MQKKFTRTLPGLDSIRSQEILDKLGLFSRSIRDMEDMEKIMRRRKACIFFPGKKCKILQEIV